MEEFRGVHVSQVEALGQVILAMLLGALVGIDREFAKKPAGLRTNMLVAGASALIVKLAEVSVMQFAGSFPAEFLRTDPIRIFVAVITGVSFLGAGTIIRQSGETRVEGLTTASALLFSSVIGMGVALSEYVLSTVATLLALVTLWFFRRVEHRMNRRWPGGKEKGEETDG